MSLPIDKTGLKVGSNIDIERKNAQDVYAKISDINGDRLTFEAPVSIDGIKVSFKKGDKIKMNFWSSDGVRYSFNSKIEEVRNTQEIYLAFLPKFVDQSGQRQLTRYAIKMPISFIKIPSKEDAFGGVTVDISGGGVKISCSKRLNVDDVVGIAFYAEKNFKHPVYIVTQVKKVDLSKNSRGTVYEIALEFLNMTESSKTDIDRKLRELYNNM